MNSRTERLMMISMLAVFAYNAWCLRSPDIGWWEISRLSWPAMAFGFFWRGEFQCR